MKILIIAEVFPPYNLIGAIRVGKTAKYLIELGHDVRVLTADVSSWTDKSLPIEISEQRILRTTIKRFNDYAPVTYSESTKFKKIFIRFKLFIKYQNPLFLLKDDFFWCKTAIKEGKILLTSWNPDIIYSSVLPFTGHIVASSLQNFSGAKWIAEYRDLWSGGYGARVNSLNRWLFPMIEKLIVRRASAFVSVSFELSNYLSNKFKKPSKVIFNGFDPVSKNITNDYKLNDSQLNKKLLIRYLGSLYEGRDCNVLLQVLSTNKFIRDNVIVEFYGYGLSELKSKINLYNLNEVVFTFDRVTHTESIELQKTSDILLFVLYNSLEHASDGILSGKCFEYLAADRPILAIGTNNNHPLISDGLMYWCASNDSLSEELQRLINEKKFKGKIFYKFDLEKNYIWSRAYQVRQLEKFMKTIFQKN
jgi:hypothetical protein